MIAIERIIAFITSLVSIITGLLGIDSNCIVKKVEDFRVSSYVVSDYIQDISALYSEDFDIITDVIIFGCATFDANGNVNIEKQELETALKNLRQTIGDRDVAININLLGPGYNGTSDVWEDQMEGQSDEHNKAFTSGVLEENIVALLDEYDFDGVHFDYEYPISLKAWLYFNNFLVSLDKELGDYTLGVAANEWNLKFSTHSLYVVDYLELMMYDMYDEEGRHSTFENVSEFVQQVGLSGVPLNKVSLGLPFYARPSDGALYWYGYSGCYTEIDENGWYRDENIGKDFWFNTPDVIEKKTDFAIKEGYGGVMIWHYNCDLPSSNELSLLRAVGKAIDSNY